jgi:hypothetical protein
LFIYLPPSPLNVSHGQQGGVKEDIMREALRVDKFIEKLRQIHLQAHEMLNKSQENYKARHDQKELRSHLTWETKFGYS